MTKPASSPRGLAERLPDRQAFAMAVTSPRHPKKGTLFNDGINIEVKKRLVAAAGRVVGISADLGDNPFDAIAEKSTAVLKKLDKDLERCVGEVADVQSAVRHVLALRGYVEGEVVDDDDDIDEPLEVFQGEAHLEDISVNVILSLDRATGEILFIEALNRKSRKARLLASNEISIVISASELVKETLAKNWEDDEDHLHALDKKLEETLLQKGWVEKNGRRMKLSQLTPGQIPSSRAWVNPNMGLRHKWEKKRKALAQERKKLLSR